MSSTPLNGLGAAAELEDLSCDLFSDARIRFSDPGFIRFERVGMYVLPGDMPLERKRLRLWWDWDGEPNAFTDVILDDDVFEEVLEPEFTDMNGESHNKVRIELTSESSPGIAFESVTSS